MHGQMPFETRQQSLRKIARTMKQVCTNLSHLYHHHFTTVIASALMYRHKRPPERNI